MSFEYLNSIAHVGDQVADRLLPQARQGEIDPAAIQASFDVLSSAWRAEGYGATPDNQGDRIQLPDVEAVSATGKAIKISQVTGESSYRMPDGSIGQDAVRPAHYRVLLGSEQRDIEIPLSAMPERGFRMRHLTYEDRIYDVSHVPGDRLTQDMRWLIDVLGANPTYHAKVSGKDSYVVSENAVVAVGVPVMQARLKHEANNAFDIATNIEAQAVYEAAQHKPRKLGMLAVKGDALLAAQTDVYRAAIARQNDALNRK